MPLCAVCTALDIPRHLAGLPTADIPVGAQEFPSEEFAHHASRSALRRAAQNGCELCDLFQRALMWRGRSADGAAAYATNHADTECSADAWVPDDDTEEALGVRFTYATFHAGYGPATALTCAMVLTSWPSYSSWTITVDDPAHRLQSGGALIIDNDKTALWHSWINECETTHGRCRQAVVTGSLPTRVIDVGTGNDEPRLIEGANAEELYVALSHVWGCQPLLRTTKSNQIAHQRGIPLSDLPPNFRDAIIITRDLGYRFLWIDSICIVQDDEAEWQRECSEMTHVYSNAVVVIAAEDAPNTSGGLLTTSEATDATHSIVISVANDFQETEILIKVQGPFDAYHRDFGRPRSRLSMRGWALQEYLLAPRILHFSGGLATMSCFEGRRRPDRKWMQSYTSIRTKLQPNIRKDMLGTNQPTEMIMQWYETLYEYSTRKLTRESDRFVAVAGVSRLLGQFFADHVETKYLAGLWSHDLVRGLAWVTRESAEAVYKKRGPNVHPSWSPLNTPGVIHFPFTSRDEQSWNLELSAVDNHHKVEYGRWDSLATVLSSSTTYHGGDPHMQIDGGQITLSAPLMSGVLVKTLIGSSARWAMHVTGTEADLTVVLDDPVSMSLTADDTIFAILLGLSNPAANRFGINAMCIRPVREAAKTYTRVGFVSNPLGQFPNKVPLKELLMMPRQEVVLV
ncbi:hypothetical protein B0A48_13506 [Cryoendolithus antarcticus]|uniref:Heterokaryon incompatibility domain-containing protein n=1 Tax=Cryoendolithus antarcticus TaxID=1507870 RepID=A0A1V8SNZ1_9PEZI|nr:hypothetical protein B0A48_13506 [Cryoendolithus antarcticus]